MITALHVTCQSMLSIFAAISSSKSASRGPAYRKWLSAAASAGKCWITLVGPRLETIRSNGARALICAGMSSCPESQSMKVAFGNCRARAVSKNYGAKS